MQICDSLFSIAPLNAGWYSARSHINFDNSITKEFVIEADVDSPGALILQDRIKMCISAGTVVSIYLSRKRDTDFTCVYLDSNTIKIQWNMEVHHFISIKRDSVTNGNFIVREKHKYKDGASFNVNASGCLIGHFENNAEVVTGRVLNDYYWYTTRLPSNVITLASYRDEFTKLVALVKALLPHKVSHVISAYVVPYY
jgi:hypothetical protein